MLIKIVLQYNDNAKGAPPTPSLMPTRPQKLTLLASASRVLRGGDGLRWPLLGSLHVSVINEETSTKPQNE